MELVKNGAVAKLLETGAIVKLHSADHVLEQEIHLRITHFLSAILRETSLTEKVQRYRMDRSVQVALMDASFYCDYSEEIKDTLQQRTEIDVNYTKPKYFFDKTIYENRVFDSHGVADPSVEIQLGPNIKDWPQMSALPENMLLKVVSEIHDPVTTTDELIPSGETSSYRSNPLGLAEFALSRKDPEYVGRAKEIQKAQKAIENGECAGKAVPEVGKVMGVVKKTFPDVGHDNMGFGSTILL